MIPIILDTDIGPDCDDAGALALLHILAKDIPAHLLAVTNCTSNPYGNGAIDVINRRYGKDDIPIGMYDKSGFLWDEVSEKYNKALCMNYENRFRDSVAQNAALHAPKALDVLKTALIEAEDSSVTFIAIGPLNNLADLIRDEDGFKLVLQKVKLLATMSCGMNQIEWNIEMDIKSAQEVYEKWPTPIITTPFETGVNIITGVDFCGLSSDHPVRLAYRLFNDGKDGIGRSSWDLTSVWVALKGAEPFFKLTESHDVSIDDDGRAIYKPNESGKVRFLLNKMSEEEISREIDKLWC